METPAFTPVADLGEFGLIDRMQAILGTPDDATIAKSIGDDAAVYRVGEGRVQVVTTDALIEGIHFNRLFMPMEHLGVKAMGVNVSDIAAMNAVPRYATLALGLPHDVSVEQVEAFYRGLRQACDTYGVTVLGGDTTAARRLTISVTLIGEADEADIVYRKGAQPGDLLCVTGDLGGAFAGLKLLLQQQQALREQGDTFVPDLSSYRRAIQRQLAPVARVRTTQHWAERGVRPHALIDISDGLASEVHHLCRQSGCGAVIEVDRLPIDLETQAIATLFEEDPETYALFGGEDYELLFALDPADREKLDPDTFTVLGIFTEADQGIHVQQPDGEMILLGTGGYQHFGTGGRPA